MRSLQNGTYENMIRNAVGFYTGYAKVNANGFWEEKTLDEALIDSPELRSEIASISNVKDVIPRIENFALASTGPLTKGVLVTGIDISLEDQVVDVRSKLKEGEYFDSNQDRSLIVSQGLAEFLELGIGDTMVLIGQGYRGTSAAGKYLVKGIMKFPAPDLNGNMVFMPYPLAQEFYGLESMLTSYILSMDDVGDSYVSGTLAAVSDKIGPKYETKTWQEMLPELKSLIAADNAGGLVFLFILYVIISFGIFGTILMMTTERIYEFGVLISIGMKRWKLMFVMALEAIMIGFIGVIAGIIFSLPFLIYFFYNPINIGGDLANFTEEMNIEPLLSFSLNPSIFYTQALYVFFIAVLLSLYPIWKISRLNVINALRS